MKKTITAQKKTRRAPAKKVEPKRKSVEIPVGPIPVGADRTADAVSLDADNAGLFPDGMAQDVHDQLDEAERRGPDLPRSGLGEAGRYFEAVGRRKSAVARVRLFTRAGDFSVNGKPYEQYFSTIELRSIVEDSLKKMKLLGRFRVSAKMSGGGMHGQAEALRHGLARCLVKFNPDFRKRLRRAGFITRDPRAKERKKFGLKKARRAPQWAKR